jgi:hypothetical protein
MAFRTERKACGSRFERRFGLSLTTLETVEVPVEGHAGRVRANKWEVGWRSLSDVGRMRLKRHSFCVCFRLGIQLDCPLHQYV